MRAQDLWQSPQRKALTRSTGIGPVRQLRPQNMKPHVSMPQHLHQAHYLRCPCLVTCCCRASLTSSTNPLKSSLLRRVQHQHQEIPGLVLFAALHASGERCASVESARPPLAQHYLCTKTVIVCKATYWRLIRLVSSHLKQMQVLQIGAADAPLPFSADVWRMKAERLLYICIHACA